MAKTNYTVARVQTRTKDSIGKYERHNERKNEHYANMNVDLSQTEKNVHYKSCGELTYNETLDKLVADGKVSLRGLKADAKVYDEMILDVNTDYFEKHGGYEFATKFYESAYRFAVKLYGEENILSAVMHADELNIALTEKYGKPIYHYHLHVVALPVVEKQIKWSKRCKDKSLVGTVKETVMQVSHSKKWKSPQLTDENGVPQFNVNGKPILIPTYSILQDEFFEYMQSQGFTDFIRGERGSTAEHQSVLQYQISKDKERLADVTQKLERQETKYEINNDVDMMLSKIESAGKKTLIGNHTLSADEYDKITTLAKNSYVAQSELKMLREENRKLRSRIWDLESHIERLEEQLRKLTELCKPYLEAIKLAPKKVKEFIDGILEPIRRQRAEQAEKLLHKPISKSKEKNK
ncbi:MAG: plasmid recombination protein [Clostridia bacterium]|nr:plasmid recombination protein [Clostridia bacterium]